MGVTSETVERLENIEKRLDAHAEAIETLLKSVQELRAWKRKQFQP